MNRRSFLLGLGMVACSGGAATTTNKMHPKKPKPKPKTTTEPTTHEGVVDTIWFESELRANRLAIRGDVLVQSIGDDELRRWNTTTMQRTDSWKLSHRHFCIVQDGTITAFGVPPKASSTVIHRIADGKVESVPGPLLPISGTNVVLPARTSDEIYVTGPENIYLLQRSGKTFDVAQILKHPGPNEATRDQWLSRGDGRIIGVDGQGGFHLLGPKNLSAAYPMTGRVVLHLLAATNDRIWYSYADIKQDYNAHTLILARVDKPIEAERTIDVAPARVVHAASSGDTLAALLFTLKSPTEMSWSVALFDESGKERWRTDVPDGFTTAGALNHGFVAVGDHRVVLAAPDGKLLAWDAATGKSVG